MKERIRQMTVEGGKRRSTCSQKPGSRAERKTEKGREKERERLRAKERQEDDRERESEREKHDARPGEKGWKRDRARRREVQERVHQACSSVRVAPLNQ